MADPWKDEEMLRVLHMRDQLGMGPTEIARKVGRSKGSVIGMLNRVDWQTDMYDLTPHLNGTMPPKWWEKGLASRT